MALCPGTMIWVESMAFDKLIASPRNIFVLPIHHVCFPWGLLASLQSDSEQYFPWPAFWCFDHTANKNTEVK